MSIDKMIALVVVLGFSTAEYKDKDDVQEEAINESIQLQPAYPS